MGDGEGVGDGGVLGTAARNSLEWPNEESKDHSQSLDSSRAPHSGGTLQ